MLKSVLCFLTIMIVSARCSVESTPALNKTSGIAVDHSAKADDHDIRLDDEALNEERGTFEIESFLSSVEIPEESLPRTYRAANMIDVPESSKALAIHKADMKDLLQIIEHNQVLATEMENFGIDIGSVVLVAMTLQSDQFSLNNLEWMVLGKVYCEKAKSKIRYSSLTTGKLFKALNIKVTDHDNIIKWTRKFHGFGVGAKPVFGKTLWLVQNLDLHPADAVKMAFGSEYIHKPQFPIVDRLIQAESIDNDVTEGLWKVNDDAPNSSREPFVIESFISSVKIADKSLPRTADMMDVSQIEERNKVLATRLENLGINLDGVVAVAKVLRSNFKRFSRNNLEWMVLGKVYFKKAWDSTSPTSSTTKQLFDAMNLEITDNKGISDWRDMFHTFRIGAKTVFGKMLWLIRDEKLNVNIADAAKMAFGSELLNARQLSLSDSLITDVTEQKIDKDAMESLIRQDIILTMQKKATRMYAGEESHDKKKTRIV